MHSNCLIAVLLISGLENRKLPDFIKSAIAADRKNAVDLVTQDGFSIAADSRYVKEIKFHLYRYTKGTLVQSFPVNWPVKLDQSNIELLSSVPSNKHYVVAPKPAGARHLLYIDSFGQIFLENSTENVFHMHPYGAVTFLLANGRVPIDTVLDGYLLRKFDHISPQDRVGRLVFVITDAICCNGFNLMNYDIIGRMNYIKATNWLEQLSAPYQQTI